MCVCVSKQSPPYRIKELRGQAQVVMQRQEGHPLQAHHDDLEHTYAHIVLQKLPHHNNQWLSTLVLRDPLSCVF